MGSNETALTKADAPVVLGAVAARAVLEPLVPAPDRLEAVQRALLDHAAAAAPDTGRFSHGDDFEKLRKSLGGIGAQPGGAGRDIARGAPPTTGVADDLVAVALAPLGMRRAHERAGTVRSPVQRAARKGLGGVLELGGRPGSFSPKPYPRALVEGMKVLPILVPLVLVACATRGPVAAPDVSPKVRSKLSPGALTAGTAMPSIAAVVSRQVV